MPRNAFLTKRTECLSAGRKPLQLGFVGRQLPSLHVPSAAPLPLLTLRLPRPLELGEEERNWILSETTVGVARGLAQTVISSPAAISDYTVTVNNTTCFLESQGLGRITVTYKCVQHRADTYRTVGIIAVII